MKKEKLFSITAKDLTLQTFRSGGKGGQHQNTTDSGVRWIHKPSGAVGESRSERSQYQNKRIALKRLVKSPKFRIWVNRMAIELSTGKTLDQRVDEAMDDKNLLTEVRGEDGKWEKIHSVTE